jgi:hypothetical protein
MMRVMGPVMDSTLCLKASSSLQGERTEREGAGKKKARRGWRTAKDEIELAPEAHCKLPER